MWAWSRKTIVGAGPKANCGRGVEREFWSGNRPEEYCGRGSGRGLWVRDQKRIVMWEWRRERIVGAGPKGNCERGGGIIVG